MHVDRLCCTARLRTRRIVNTQRAKTVIENALRRGITRVDFSFNELSPSAVGEVVQRASDLLLQAAAAYHPGQAPSLFLQMRQFTRRWVVFGRGGKKGDAHMRMFAM